MEKSLILLLFSLKIPWLLASIYTGTQNICSLSECECILNVVECVCTKNSTFQEYLQFRDDRRNLQELILKNCDKIVFPPQSISAGSHLKSIQIFHSKQVEFKTESLPVSRLTLLNISHVDSVVFQQQTFQSFNDDSPVVSVFVESASSLVINTKAFASIKSLHFTHIKDLHLEPSALKLKVPTQEPTILINMTDVNIKSLASSAFASSFKKILVQDSNIDRMETNAFSGFKMTHVKLVNVDINRIERGAFSDQSVIELLEFSHCRISSIAKKSIVAGISELNFENSFVQSISKYGAINATVASVRVVNNTFRTLGQESLSLESWNSVIITDNTIQFMEEGALNAIFNPIPMDNVATFEFARNEVQNANRHSLVTRIPEFTRVLIAGNRFSHHCDCKQDQYIKSLTGHSGLSTSFQDLSLLLINSSSCGVPASQAACFPDQHFTPIPGYQLVMCGDREEGPPPCILLDFAAGEGEGVGGGSNGVAVYSLNQFYDDFLILFQVKTNKGILLFLLFCVLSCVCILSICVGSIWIHRLCKRSKLMKSNKLSGSFQFNSKEGEKAEILRYGSNHTSGSSNQEFPDEPQYAEIAEIHPPPTATATTTVTTTPRTVNGTVNSTNYLEFRLRQNNSLMRREDSNNSSDDLEATTMTDLTTLPKSGMTTLPSSLGANTLPLHTCETDRLLPYNGGTMGPALAQSTPMDKGRGRVDSFMDKGRGRVDSIRVSMSETSLTDEIMMALRDRLNDPTLYCTVMDAKGGVGVGVGAGAEVEEELYTAPIYNDPAPVNNT